jgi:TATA-box binding protein (TBP) (component of TFIID and TFIIIB)
VVSTYTTQVDVSDAPVNLAAVAMVCSGKYSRGVFPAVVSKARIPIAGAPLFVPDAATVYPLHRKVKHPKTLQAKQALAARNKKLKELSHLAEQLAPRQFMTATDSQFKSGQNVVAGGTSVERNTLVAYQFVRRLNHDLHLNLRIYNMKTQNIVCSADLGFELNPEWIVQEADAKGWEVYYCPEEFIGLSWITYDDNIKIVYVVFSTGKIVATGIRHMHHIAVAQERMHRLISPFRKGNEPADFSEKHSHMRDAATLSSIKKDVLSNTRGAGHQQQGQGKANAAKKHSKKLTREVKQLMKQIECVTNENAADDDENEDVVNFSELIDRVDEDMLPVKSSQEEKDDEEEEVVWVD